MYNNYSLQCIYILLALVWTFHGSSAYSRHRGRVIRETNENCQVGFKCKNGQCINENSVCDGTNDCSDGSDEAGFCQRIRANSSSDGSCILPAYPVNGKLSVRSGSQLKPGGTSVPSGSIIEISCNAKYTLDGAPVVLCKNGSWNTEIARCLSTCSSIRSTRNMEVTCSVNNRETVNCTEPISGTVAKFKCKPFYEDPSLKRNFYRYCINGLWDRPLPDCVPVCGIKPVVVQPLTVDPVKINEYPWQVALYSLPDKILICGGSLITERLIITAAHCVTNVTGMLYDKEKFEVAVGKYYFSYDDVRDKDKAKFSKLSAIFLPEAYKGDIQNYVADIAVLVAEKPFKLTRNTLPICVDWNLSYENDLATPGVNGFVPGWGLKMETLLPSEDLQEMQLSNLDNKACAKELPEHFQSYLTYDKICAKYSNQTKPLCKGGSGGGLVFKNNDNEGRFYITGLLSLSPSDTSHVCHGGFGFFTEISKHLNFISKIERDYRLLDK